MTKNFSCQKKQERSLAPRGGENLGWEKEKKILQKYVQEVKKIKTNRYISFGFHFLFLYFIHSSPSPCHDGHDESCDRVSSSFLFLLFLFLDFWFNGSLLASLFLLAESRLPTAARNPRLLLLRPQINQSTSRTDCGSTRTHQPIKSPAKCKIFMTKNFAVTTMPLSHLVSSSLLPLPGLHSHCLKKHKAVAAAVAAATIMVTAPQ